MLLMGCSEKAFSTARQRVGVVSERILVTGGAGYIGSHACKLAARAGYEPIAYDNLVNGHEWAVKWGPLEVGDVRDGNRLLEVMSRYSPVAVMHFAAFAYVGESIQEPLKYYHNNVVGSLTLFDAMARSGINKIVFSSTCAVYGSPQAKPISESTPTHPISPYGASKQMIERSLGDLSRATSLRYVALRYFNAAGADPGGEIGEVHEPETHLVPSAIRAALGRRGELTLYGNDYPTRDGTCIRDYVHVSDLAEAHVRALRYLEEDNESLAINLGTGREVSVLEVLAAVKRFSGHKVPYAMGQRRGGDPPTLVASNNLAAQKLGWLPVRSSLDEIVATAYAWELSRR